MPHIRRIALLGLALLAASPAMADEITDGLDRARQLYGQGDLNGATTEANFALTALMQKRSALYAGLFPAAPSGWTLEPLDEGQASQGAMAASLLGGGVMVERTYSRQGGDATIEATLLVNTPMIQAMGALTNNPAMLPPGARRIRIGSDNAILQRDESANTAELTLVRGNIAIKLAGQEMSDGDVLVELLKRFDLARIQNPPAAR